MHRVLKMKRKFTPDIFLPLFLFFTLSIIVACSEDDNKDIITDSCSLPIGHLKWTTQGTPYCANATLFADQAIVMTINGITQAGLSMTLELDSVEPGTYTMDDNTNHLLFTDQYAFDWQSSDDQPGTIVITKNDKSANQIEGTFQVNAKNSITGTFRQISNGNFRLTYTE